eukprot:sb/3474440/
MFSFGGKYIHGLFYTESEIYFLFRVAKEYRNATNLLSDPSRSPTRHLNRFFAPARRYTKGGREITTPAPTNSNTRQPQQPVRRSNSAPNYTQFRAQRHPSKSRSFLKIFRISVSRLVIVATCTIAQSCCLYSSSTRE